MKWYVTMLELDIKQCIWTTKIKFFNNLNKGKIKIEKKKIVIMISCCFTSCSTLSSNCSNSKYKLVNFCSVFLNNVSGWIYLRLTFNKSSRPMYMYYLKCIRSCLYVVRLLKTMYDVVLSAGSMLLVLFSRSRSFTILFLSIFRYY